MAYQMKKLLLLLSIVIGPGLVDRLGYGGSWQVTIGEFSASWPYLLSVAVLMYLCFSVLNLRCANQECRKLQIYRGVSPLDWRLPGDYCYACGSMLR